MGAGADARIESLLADGEVVLLDGGVASAIAGELPRADGLPTPPPDTWAIYDAPSRVLDVHRRYAAAGCDVVSTNTWGLLAATSSARGRRSADNGLPAWTMATRDAVRLARQGIDDAGRTGDCAVAFCLNDADPLFAGEEPLLNLLWAADPPDLVVIETLPALASPAVKAAILDVASAGMPVWVSFQWPAAPPDGLIDGLADLEAVGVRAVLVNCVTPARAREHLDTLLASTALPVGCYPRLEEPLEPRAYAELARSWREHGASIIGGCCGVGPEHIAAVRARQPRTSRSAARSAG